MTDQQPISENAAPILVPPPRRVPGALARYIWTHPALVRGSIVFGVTVCIGFLAITPTEILSSTLLLVRSEETLGILERSNKTVSSVGGNRHSSGITIYRHQYRFQNSDGTKYRGWSYSEGRPQQIDPTLGQQAKVTVTFNPWFPQASRVKGTRVLRLGPVAIFALLFPLFGIIAIIVCLRRTSRLRYLLRHGLLTNATITLYRNSKGEEYAPFKEFRKRWEEQHESLLKTQKLETQKEEHFILSNWERSVDRHERLLESRKAEYTSSGGLAEKLIPYLGCMARVIFWTGLVLILILFVLLMGAIHAGPDALGFLGLAVVWVAFGYGWSWIISRFQQRKKNRKEQVPTRVLDCTLELTTANGENVTKTEYITITKEVALFPTVKVLYDPSKPSRVALLQDLKVEGEIDAHGEWKFPVSNGKWLTRGLAIAFCVFVLPPLGWWVHVSLP